MHANAVAEIMGSFPVIVPPAPGLLCALGDIVADFRDEFARTYIRVLDEADPADVSAILDELGGRAQQWLADEGIDPDKRSVTYTADMRYHGQGYEIPVSLTPEEVRGALAESIAAILRPLARPLALDPAKKPQVILVVGVNGTGKTTTIGKLAQRFREDRKRVMIAAGDTFRAAAIEQLKIWGDRTGAAVIARETGADAAGLAYDALAQAQAAGADVLLIDTAGRLHNKADLMAELQKIIRVLRKLDPTAPQDCLLVLDATTGQNAHQQVDIFRQMTQVTGLVVTKLDGTARGGVVVALAERFQLPLHAIGVGEGADDLRPFDADAFARSLMGL